MIERSELDGRPVFLVYIGPDFQPANKGEETMIKVIYRDNGETMWLTTPPEDEEDEADEADEEETDESDAETLEEDPEDDEEE
jgi:hypothetical protein